MSSKPFLIVFGVVSPLIGLLALILEIMLFGPAELTGGGLRQGAKAFLGGAPVAILLGVVFAYPGYRVFKILCGLVFTVRWLGGVALGVFIGYFFLLVLLLLGYKYRILYSLAPFLGAISSVLCLVLYKVGPAMNEPTSRRVNRIGQP